MNNQLKIAVIGLGYVGLPLAASLSQHFPVVGYDINKKRVKDLSNNIDDTLELSSEELEKCHNLQLSDSEASISCSNIYIITVPTPVDSDNHPDLSPLEKASKNISKHLKKGDIVVYESTVFPGATEEICAKILEDGSHLKLNQDFSVGYSPERINPGDKVNTLSNITKVLAASNEKAKEVLNTIYGKIIKAGIYLAPSIKVAEAAKAIENTQRDLNIAFMNELSMMFHHLGIDTLDVIETASTKWNFLPFKPGLVGGHCIGVDPYYLIQKSKESGYYPQLITTARRINESMSQYIVDRILKKLALKKIHVVHSNILVMGLTFKENCPDLRNTKVIEVIRNLEQCHANIDVYDPWADSNQTQKEFNIQLKSPKEKSYDGIVLAVPHKQFYEMGIETIQKLLKPEGVIFDLKGMFPQSEHNERL